MKQYYSSKNRVKTWHLSGGRRKVHGRAAHSAASDLAAFGSASFGLASPVETWCVDGVIEVRRLEKSHWGRTRRWRSINPTGSPGRNSGQIIGTGSINPTGWRAGSLHGWCGLVA